MRTLGSEVARGRWGWSAIGRSPTEPLAAGGVAVLVRCTALGLVFMWLARAPCRSAPRPVFSSFMGDQDPSGGHDYLAREARARKEIDKQLAAAGWVVQSQKALNLSAAPAVAVREFTLEKPHGRVDYLLFLNGQPAGVDRKSVV